MHVDHPQAAAAPKRPFGIGERMAVLVCALLAVLTTAGVVWRYFRIERELVRLEFVQQQAAAGAAAAQLTSGIDSLRQDAAFLASVPTVQEFLRARRAALTNPAERRREQQWRQRLAELYEARLRTTPQYFQILLIDTSGEGREIIRVERQGAKAVVVAAEQLQEKAGRSYFEQARQSPPGVVYVSRIDLNEEHGQVSEPRTPTLRAAAAIADPGGEAQAVLVINKDLRPPFSDMMATAGHNRLYVFDENLDFVLHPDSSRAFGFQFDKPFRLTQQFPGLRETLLPNGPPQAQVDDLIRGTNVVATVARVQPDPGVSSRSYGVLLATDFSDTIAPLIERRWQLVVFNLLLVAATSGTVLLFSRRLTRPLRQITAAVHEFGQGRGDLKLPLQAGDEAGVLARAFDGMFHEVRRNETSLQAEIAERRRAEMAWRDSEQRLRLALDAAQAGVWEWNAQTDRTFWDKTIRDAVDADSDAFPENSSAWLALVHPDDRDAIPAERQRAIDEDRPYAVDFRIRGPKRQASQGEPSKPEWRHRRTRGVVIRDDSGRPLKLIGISSDVTDEKLAEAARLEGAERLRLALAAAQAGVWEWDLHTDQTRWDSSIEGMAGFDPATFPGSIDSWLELMHPDDANNVPEARRRTVEQDEPFEAEFRIRGPHGDWRHWNARGILVRDEDGGPLKLVGVSWDVTETQRSQEQIRQYAAELERKNREMEQFVYSVSHDLKSPLVTCKGFTGILKEDLAEGKISEALDSAQRVERATQHMGRLIEDLLQLSRVGRVTAKPETVAVSDLVGPLAEELRLASKPDVRVVVQPDMPAILADPMSVRRLFQNLLANALQYGCSAAEPRIEVGSVLADREVRFFVRDNGAGISPEYHEKIFGLFQRLEANQTGTGIGLAIVSKIMEVHCGRVWIESAPGEGAAFWLAFPAHFLAEPVLPRSPR